MITIELTESDKAIERKIMLALAAEMNDRVNKSLKKIVLESRIWMINYLKNTDEYRALQDQGELAAHFGIPWGQGKAQADELINVAARGIDISFNGFTVYGSKFKGEMVLSILKADLAEVLSLDYHNNIVSEKTGTHIKWIEWLLTAGDQIIITDYKIEFWPGQGRSLSAIMKFEAGEVWRVPPKYAGIITDNWLTRRIVSTNFQDGIAKIIEKNL